VRFKWQKLHRRLCSFTWSFTVPNIIKLSNKEGCNRVGSTKLWLKQQLTNLWEILGGCRSGVHMENIGVWDSSSSWSTGLGSTAWSNLPANNTERLNNIGGFYTTPSAQSVWSYNAS
jgi:hypothetical protein